MNLNTVAISTCTGRLGSDTPKDLYLCKSWEELEGKVQGDVNVNLPSSSAKEALESLNKICLVAVSSDLENDEELAFLNYSRYLNACRTFSQQKDNDMEMLDCSEFKIGENLSLTLKILEVLKDSLIGRYKDSTIQSQLLENKIKIVRPILEEHRANLEAELEAKRNLKRAREELKSLCMNSQILEEESHRQQQNKRPFPLDNDNVPEQLQCPVCFEVYLELVFQCKNGHNICSTCYSDSKVTACPECRDNFGSAPVRNRALEELVLTWGFDCPYRENGCHKKILCRQMAEHSESCFYRKSEKRRKIVKVEMEIKEKEDQVEEYQVKLSDASARRMKTKTEWWKLQLNGKFGGAIEKVVQELNLEQMEQQLYVFRT